MNNVMRAANLLNSIKAYTLSNIEAEIASVSIFASVPMNGQPASADSGELEYEVMHYITCGESLCGSEMSKTNEICSRE